MDARWRRRFIAEDDGVNSNYTSNDWVALYNLFTNNPTKKYELTIIKADGSTFTGLLTKAELGDVPTQLYTFELNGGSIDTKEMMVRGGGAGYWGAFDKLNFINAGTGNPKDRTSGEIKGISVIEETTKLNNLLQSLFSWWNTEHNFNNQNLGIFSPKVEVPGTYATSADALTYLQKWSFSTYKMETKGVSHPNQQWPQIIAGTSSGAGSTGDFHTDVVIPGQGWNGMEFFYNATTKKLEMGLYKAYINTFNGTVKGITLPTITLV